jgi:hypothetical protein
VCKQRNDTRAYLDHWTDERAQLEDSKEADVDFIQHLLAVLRIGHGKHVARSVDGT